MLEGVGANAQVVASSTNTNNEHVESASIEQSAKPRTSASMVRGGCQASLDDVSRRVSSTAAPSRMSPYGRLSGSSWSVGPISFDVVTGFRREFPWWHHLVPDGMQTQVAAFHPDIVWRLPPSQDPADLSHCLSFVRRCESAWYVGITEYPPLRWSDHARRGFSSMFIIAVGANSRITAGLEREILAQCGRRLNYRAASVQARIVPTTCMLSHGLNR